MIQKTIRGKKCPQCSSFIKADQEICNVCGFEFKEKNESIREETELPLTVVTDSDSVACPKCKTRNNIEFKFCKICKFPLKGAGPDKNEPAFKLSLKFDWFKSDADEFLRKEQDFDEFSPYFSGCLQWQGYGFFVYKNRNKFEIFTRKTDISCSAVLYKKCLTPSVLSSGAEFFLGTVKMKLLGNSDPALGQQTVPDSNKTVFVGPGEALNGNSDKKGLPRLKICAEDLKADEMEIAGKIILGRNFLVNRTGLDHEVMRKNGISNEHVVLTPLQGSSWLLEPLPGKPIFTELGEEPVILDGSDILRLVSDSHVGEFKIGIKETGR